MICPPVDAAASMPLGLRGPIAQLFHQRNGERPRGDHIGDGRSADRPHTGACDNCSLGRTAALTPCRSIGEINKELACTCDLKKGPEQYKNKDKSRRNTKRDTKDPLGAQRHLTGNPFQRVAAVVQNARHPVRQKRQLPAGARKGIGQKEGPDDRHAKSNGPACALQHDKEGQDPHPDINLARKDLVGDDIDVHGHPGPDGDATQDQRPVDRPAQQTARLIPAEDRVDQETEHQNKAQVDGPLEKQAQWLHPRRIELEQ